MSPRRALLLSLSVGLILALVIYFGIYTFAYYNEEIHRVACEQAGGEASIEYGLTGAVTKCQGFEPENLERMREFNYWNEIAGYYSIAVIMNLWLMLLVYIGFKSLEGGRTTGRGRYLVGLP